MSLPTFPLMTLQLFHAMAIVNIDTMNTDNFQNYIDGPLGKLWDFCVIWKLNGSFLLVCFWVLLFAIGSYSEALSLLQVCDHLCSFRHIPVCYDFDTYYNLCFLILFTSVLIIQYTP